MLYESSSSFFAYYVSPKNYTKIIIVLDIITYCEFRWEANNIA